MPRQIKELMVAELEEKFRNIDETGCVFVSYRGLDANQARDLRHAVRQSGGDATVVKNTIFARAMERLGATALDPLLEGPIMVIRAEDAVQAAKAAQEVARQTDALQIRGAYAEGRALGSSEVDRLARIPGRDALLACLAGGLLGHVRILGFALLAKPRALLNALTQLRDAREEGPNDA
jgi:ribosomal protein L10